ncbi:hypothetical protein LJR258_005235 [Rhizobium sp. LjRoot258]
MLVRRIRDNDMAMLSRSVQTWYKHYRATPNERASEMLCSAAISLFNQGHNTQEELTTLLIARYPGPTAVLINAPTSRSTQ